MSPTLIHYHINLLPLLITSYFNSENPGICHPPFINLIIQFQNPHMVVSELLTHAPVVGEKKKLHQEEYRAYIQFILPLLIQSLLIFKVT